MLAGEDNRGRAGRCRVGATDEGVADHVLRIRDDGHLRSATWQLCNRLFIRGKYDFTSQFILLKYK
jgi:hypothetical protein